MVELIAEIGQAHDGSLGILHSYIDALANTGVDTVKFQMHIADAESSSFEQFRINFSYKDRTRYDYWKRMEFTFEEWVGIKTHCEEKKLRFLCSPFSVEAFEWCEKMGVERYKIASGEVNNYLLLDIIANTRKPVIISSGMSSFYELDNAISRFQNYPKENISILQCTTEYPTTPENVGLNVITEMLDRYPYKVGLSDHSGVIYPILAAVTLGASICEFHVVFHKQMFGPDSCSSLDLQQIQELVKGVRFIETAVKNKVDKNNVEKYEKSKLIFGKSLGLRRDKQKNSEIFLEDLETRKPSGYGIPADNYKFVIGKKVKKDLKKFDFLNYDDLIE